jgi:trehalose 6-phosphate phosphatase
MPHARLLPAPDATWAYFLDIDGTLLDLARAPDAVRVTPELYDLLASLHTATGGAVALISGRSLSDIDTLFPGIPLQAAGQHGLERRDRLGVHSWGGPSIRDVPAARSRLDALVARHRSLLLEDKGDSVALHYRTAPALEHVVYETVRAVRAELGDEFRVQAGKYVVELRPSGIDKGDAVAAFMETSPFEGRVPVFVGDDVTDEHGFAVVNALDGHSVKVGAGETLARWRLTDARAVERWLSRMRHPA